MQQYRYALTANNVLVDVMRFSENDRGEYFCLECGQALIPVLPAADIIKHFRHKDDSACSGGESYLHRAAKIAFCQAYKFHQARGGYFINYNEQNIKVNPLFGHVSIEEQQDGFTPDVTISARDGRKFYIEIAYTNPVDIAKVNRIDAPLFEIDIHNEDDIANKFRANTPSIRVGKVFGDTENLSGYLSAAIWISPHKRHYLDALSKLPHLDLSLASHRCIALELGVFDNGILDTVQLNALRAAYK